MILKNCLKISICLIISAVSCNKGPQTLPEFDYKTDYPQKEFSYSDNFDINSIPIETDSLLIDKSRILYISDEFVIALTGKDRKFITIDKSGKILNSFSRVGNAAEEYLSVQDVFYDSQQKEFYILDAQKKRILILDNAGLYKREFPIVSGHGVSAIMNLNDNSFITYNCNLGMQEDLHGSYSIMSKTDGAIIKDIIINSDGKKRYPSVINLPKFISIYKMTNMIPGDDYVLLSEAYCDTVYRMSRQDFSLTPYFIKSPAFNTLPDNDKFFMSPCLDTPDYTIFVKLNSKYDDSKANFTSEEFFYDKKENKFYKVANKYVDNNEFGPFYSINYKNYGLSGYTLDIMDLYKMEKQNLLDESLKQILSKANENDNPVLVLMNLKNK